MDELFRLRGNLKRRYYFRQTCYGKSICKKAYGKPNIAVTLNGGDQLSIAATGTMVSTGNIAVKPDFIIHLDDAMSLSNGIFLSNSYLQEK